MLRVKPRSISSAASTDFLTNLVLSSLEVPNTASGLTPSVFCSMACRNARGNKKPWNYPNCNAFMIEDVGGANTCRLGYVTPMWVLDSDEMGSGLELYTDIVI